jgi:8-oxo-dGTP pyrophosphatase MutT (NUDIX family)
MLVVELVDPISGRVYILPPGGQVEPGESSTEAALRETLEETGYRVLPIPTDKTVARYEFYWSGQNYQCTTELVAVKIEDPAQLLKQVRPTAFTSYITKVDWLPVAEALDRMKFIPEFYAAVQSLLLKLQRN